VSFARAGELQHHGFVALAPWFSDTQDRCPVAGGAADADDDLIRHRRDASWLLLARRLRAGFVDRPTPPACIEGADRARPGRGVLSPGMPASPASPAFDAHPQPVDGSHARTITRDPRCPTAHTAVGVTGIAVGGQPASVRVALGMVVGLFVFVKSRPELVDLVLQ
jgi:hypothetical protein